MTTANKATNTVRFTIHARNGARWKDDLITAIAQNVGGFNWGRKHVSRLDLPGILKAAPIAHIERETWAAQIGDGVTDIHVVMDLDTCCLGLRAFDEAIGKSRKMAEALDADLLDGDGAPLTDAREAADKARVTAAQDGRRAALKKPVRELPDGTVVQQREASFITTHQTRRGRYLGGNSFDVPALPYSEGKIHGLRCMLELLDLLNSYSSEQGLMHHQILSSIKEACRVEPDRLADIDQPSKGNVALGFLDVVASAVIFFARNSRYQPFIQARIDSHQSSLEWWSKTKAEQKDAFVKRMKEARAKKARREALDSRKAPPSGPNRSSSKEVA